MLRNFQSIIHLKFDVRFVSKNGILMLGVY